MKRQIHKMNKIKNKKKKINKMKKLKKMKKMKKLKKMKNHKKKSKRSHKKVNKSSQIMKKKNTTHLLSTLLRVPQVLLISSLKHPNKLKLHKHKKKPIANKQNLKNQLVPTQLSNYSMQTQAGVINLYELKLIRFPSNLLAVLNMNTILIKKQ